MNRILQSVLLILFVVFVQVLSPAQSVRLKTAAVGVAPDISQSPNTAIQKSKDETAAVKKEIPHTSPESKSASPILKKNMDSLAALKNNNSTSEIEKQKPANTEPFTDNSVEYFIETLPEQATVNNAERKTVKPAVSVNYKQREVKQDIHPVQDFTHPGIAESKRLYLQQEADDLQAEIKQNANNPNYDIAKKQRQLEDIRKLLQP